MASFLPKNKRIETDESVKRNDVSGIQPLNQYLDYLIVCLKHLFIFLFSTNSIDYRSMFFPHMLEIVARFLFQKWHKMTIGITVLKEVAP